MVACSHLLRLRNKKLTEVNLKECCQVISLSAKKFSHSSIFLYLKQGMVNLEVKNEKRSADIAVFC